MHEDVSLSSIDYDPEIRLHSRALEGSSANARLFLWNETEYNKHLSSNGITTLDDAPKWIWADNMSLPIDNFLYDYEKKSGTPYNTAQTWPGDALVYASGIGPDDAYDWDDPESSYDGVILRDNIILRSDMRDGLVELVASNNDSYSRGNTANPFVKPGDDQRDYNEERELKFRHLTSAITFKGKRDVNMSNKIGVKNIIVTINNKDKADQDYAKKIAVPTSIRRYVGTNQPSKFGDTQLPSHPAWTYVVGSTETPNEIRNSSTEKLEMTLKPDDPPVDLMTFYVLSEGINYGTSDGEFNPFVEKVNITDKKPSLDISIYAEYFLAGNESEVRCIQWNHVLIKDDAWSVADDADPTGDQFLPAHKYEVTLTFDSNSVGLRAELVPWVEEDPAYLPVWGTTPTSLFIKINDAQTTEESDVTKKQIMYTPDNNLYGVIADLKKDQYISFFSYDNYGNKTVEPLDAEYNYSYDDLIVNTTDANGPINDDNMVQFVGEDGKYVIRLDKARKKIFCIPFTEDNYGVYLNEVKLSAGPYDDCYGSTAMIQLTPYDSTTNPEQYHLSRLSADGEEFLSLEGFRYDAAHFSYNAPSKGLIFKGDAGYYHIVYDEETNNIASMLIARGKDDTGYTEIQEGYYFGRNLLTLNSDGIAIFETSVLSYDDIISISRINADVVNNESTPAITVSKFYEGTEPAEETGIVYWTVAEGSKDFFHIETDGSLRFRPKGSKLHRFTIDTENKVISCQYLSDSFRNVYIINGGDPIKASAINNQHPVLDLRGEGATAELSITYTDNEYHTTAIDLRDISYSQVDGKDIIEAVDATYLRLKSDVTKGYYKLTFNFTGATGTITAERVRNADGDPLLNEWRVNGDLVNGQYYYIYQNTDWTTSNDQTLNITYTDGTTDTPRAVNYHDWEILTPTIFGFNDSSNPTALHLKDNNDQGTYKITIDVWYHKISAQKYVPAHIPGMIVGDNGEDWFDGNTGETPSAWAYSYSDDKPMGDNHLVTWTNTSGIPSVGMYLKPNNNNTVTLTTNSLSLPAGKIKFTIYAAGFWSGANIKVTISKNNNIVLSKSDATVDKLFGGDKLEDNVIQADLPNPYTAVTIIADNTIEGGDGYTLSIENSCGGWRPFLILGFKIETE